ncbi:hypothetical protein N482_15015 [Pseudoalteromonas luteoviolacea NCIMB 1942]|uniref:Uncharacterized protein n=1 Tax=Pseudoalteromonas luteoviolacea NCIMB 1942 TaxID=1365253 RepID=A0A167ALU3_9GAMM|nr:hypothetical protein N482_15015 [Pseudoalteromonas luteoviolacea NCIMB 1942]
MSAKVSDIASKDLGYVVWLHHVAKIKGNPFK